MPSVVWIKTTKTPMGLVAARRRLHLAASGPCGVPVGRWTPNTADPLAA